MRLTTNGSRIIALPLAAGLAALMLALLFSLLAPRVARAGGVVTTCDQSNLEAALAGGGSVTFNCGAPATITFASQIVITQNTTIDGGTLGQVTLSGNNVTRLFTTTPGATLTLLNLTLRDGNSDQEEGGALWAAGPAVISNSAFISNTARDDGGAIYAAGAPLTITGSVFWQNLSPDYGGAVNALGSVWVTNSEFYSNTAEGGGALALEAEAHIASSRFYSNTADSIGGAIYSYNGGLVWVSASWFYSNTALVGGGINAAGLGLWLTSSTLHHNAAANDGGGLNTANPATISGSEFYSNTAEYGGGVLAYGSVTITTSSLHHNTADRAGGGLGWYDATTQRGAAQSSGVAPQNGIPNRAVLTDVDLYSNRVTAGYGGGADFEGESVRLVRVRVFNNRIDTGSANYAGGGLSLFYGHYELVDSAVYGNVAGTGPGGGVHLSYGAIVTVTGSAIYSNTTVTGAGGGISALSTGGVSKLRLFNSTVSGNAAQIGGGIHMDAANTYAVISYTTLYSNQAGVASNFTGTAELHNSVIAGSPASNCGGAIKSYGYNLEDGETCGLNAYGDITNIDPQLAPLGWNGGPTWTHAPLPDSQLIDNADPVDCPATDQRGAARPVDGDLEPGAQCDIGAHEFAAIVARLFLPISLR